MMINKGRLAALSLLAMAAELPQLPERNTLRDILLENRIPEPLDPRSAPAMATRVGAGTGRCECGKTISLNKRACRAHSTPEDLEKR